jgi:hypothetical protein
VESDCGSGPTTSIWSAGGALTDRMTAATLRVRADIRMRVLHMYMYRHNSAEVVLTLFKINQISKYAVESQIQTAIKRISDVCCRIQL